MNLYYIGTHCENKDMYYSQDTDVTLTLYINEPYYSSSLHSSEDIDDIIQTLELIESITDYFTLKIIDKRP